MWGAFLQKPPEIFQEIVPIFRFRELMVPHAFDKNAVRGQETVPLEIVCLLAGKSVSGPVEFDGKLGFDAINIQVVRFLGMLAAEFVSSQTAGSQQTPELLFGPSGLFAQCSRPCGRHEWVSKPKSSGRQVKILLEPSPRPSPIGWETECCNSAHDSTNEAT
jgi:hypothetical protein